MLTHPRLFALAAMLVSGLVCTILWVASPIHITVSFDRDTPRAAAAPRRDIAATATPPSPTEPPSTATALPPTPTTVPSPTALPPTTQPPSPTDEPTPQPTKLPPTASATPSKPHTNDPRGPALPTATLLPPRETPELGRPDVSIVKSVDRPEAGPGDSVVFQLVVGNAGSVPAHDVVVADVVPAAFQVTDLTSTKGDLVVDGQQVTAYPAMLAPGEMVTIRITARVRPDAEAGQHRNTALVTISTPNDNPGDNTSTVVITVRPPPAAQKQSLPLKASPKPQLPLPVTADPDAPTFLMIYGPWMMLALFVAMFGVMVRLGMFRTRYVRVSLAPRGFAPQPRRVSSPVRAEPQQAMPFAAALELDAMMIVERWRSGESVLALSNEIAAANPLANKVLISLAVQQMIDDEMHGRQLRRKNEE